MSDKTIAEPWIDPDDAPPLDAAWFDGADVYRGTELVWRGSQKLAAPKRLVSLRLDGDVIDRLRAAGPGWQTRVNEALRKVVGL